MFARLSQVSQPHHCSLIREHAYASVVGIRSFWFVPLASFCIMPQWLSLTAINSEGNQVAAKCKCWCGGVDACFTWDGVMALDNLYTNQKLGRVINDNWEDWNKLWAVLHIPVQDCFVPSLRQYAAMEKLPIHLREDHLAHVADIARLKDVHQFGTSSLLAVFLNMCAFSRKAPKTGGRTSLLCLVDAYCSSDAGQQAVNFPVSLPNIVAEHECDSPLGADGLCNHLRHALAECVVLPAGPLRNIFLVDVLVRLTTFAMACPRSAAVLEHVVKTIAPFIESGIEELPEQSPIKGAFPRGKRKCDGDLKHFLMDGMISSGRAASSAAGVRAEYGLNGTKKARKWSRDKSNL